MNKYTVFDEMSPNDIAKEIMKRLSLNTFNINVPILEMKGEWEKQISDIFILLKDTYCRGVTIEPFIRFLIDVNYHYSLLEWNNDKKAFNSNFQSDMTYDAYDAIKRTYNLLILHQNALNKRKANTVYDCFAEDLFNIYYQYKTLCFLPSEVFALVCTQLLDYIGFRIKGVDTKDTNNIFITISDGINDIDLHFKTEGDTGEKNLSKTSEHIEGKEIYEFELPSESPFPNDKTIYVDGNIDSAFIEGYKDGLKIMDLFTLLFKVYGKNPLYVINLLNITDIVDYDSIRNKSDAEYYSELALKNYASHNKQWPSE